MTSRRRLVDLPSDQHAADFLCAGADLVELRIAQQASGGVIVDVSVAAERLYGLQTGLRGLIRAEENGRRSVLARAAPRIAGAADGIGVRARCIERGVHVGD